MATLFGAVTTCPGLSRQSSWAAQVVGVQPAVDAFGDVGPAGFEHHVVPHREELRLGRIRARRGAHLGATDEAVVGGAEHQASDRVRAAKEAAHYIGELIKRSQARRK